MTGWGGISSVGEKFSKFILAAADRLRHSLPGGGRTQKDERFSVAQFGTPPPGDDDRRLIRRERDGHELR